MIRYITLSVYSMIITRVFIKLREKLLKYRYPEAQDKFIKSIGVDPVEYMYAVNYAPPKGGELAMLPMLPWQAYSTIGWLTCTLPSRFSEYRLAAS